MSHPYDMGDTKKASVLGPTLVFKGELTASEDLLIQGRVEGSINHTSSLTIGKEGKIKANVKAEHISVEGTVEGDLVANASVVVKESANVNGNIFSPTVTLREGSRFNGKIDMSGKDMPQAASPTNTSNGHAQRSEADSEREKAAAKNAAAGNKQSASAA